MKKSLALILSILALLIPVSAIELDVAEAAENVSVAEEAVLAALPETTDATYGDLIYFSDFDDNTNWVNKEIVGESATASYQLAYVQKGNWSSNIVTDPKGENGNVQELIVADANYNWATGCNMALQNVTLNNAVVTMVWDVYFPTPVTENFRVQTTDGWADITTADYDGEAGGWQTIVMSVPLSATVSNGNYGFNFICNDGTRNANKSATAGLTYYIDNLKVYIKEPVYATKPAAVDSTLGNLIYFDNGNSADAVSSDKIGVYGVSDLSGVEGYYSKKIYRNTDVGMLSPGIVVKSANGTFVENGLDGTLTLVTDVYSSSELKYYKIADIASYGWFWGASWYAGPSVNSNTTYPTLNADLKTTGTAASGFGVMRSEDSGTPYTRSIAVYYMPATRVTVDGVIVDLHGMTEYTLPAFETNEYDSYKDASGNIFDAGKAYAVADINGKVLTPYLKPKYAAKPAETTEDGELVFFYNGNAADTVNTLGADIIGEGSMGVYDGYHVTYTTDCTALLGSCASHGMAIAPSGDAYAKNGRITLVVEQYNNMTNKASVDYTALSSVKLGAYTSAWGGKYVNYGNTTKTYPGNWYTLKATALTDNELVGFFERDWINHSNLTRGFKSIYVYLDSYKVTIGNTVVDLADYKEYTLPAGEGFNYYKDASGAYYEAGKAYASSDLDGKTLTAIQLDYATKPADFNLGRGILVYFDNGNEEDFYSNINATLVGFDNTTDADGYFTRDLNNPASAGISGTVGIGLDTGDTETKLAYADGTDMAGAIYLVVDMYNNSDANNSFYRALRTKTDWAAWCGVYTDWTSVAAPAKAWSGEVVSNAFDSELSFIGFGDTNGNNWQGSTFRRVYAYYMPNTRITLNDTVKPQIVDLTGKTEYTFPEISDGNTVWAGQDGSYYFPGDVAAAADINGITFDTANFNDYAPVTEEGVEMRLSSDTATNGIRFKASIAPSKKANADEIGFIVAREDILNHLGADLTFDLAADGVENAEGKLFVKGVAYDKAAGKDVVYGATDDGAAEIFTAVCVGINIENKTQVTSVLVARPYTKLTVNDKTITVYGNTNSASLADVANGLKAAADAGDEAAKNAYEGSKEYIETVIATAE